MYLCIEDLEDLWALRLSYCGKIYVTLPASMLSSVLFVQVVYFVISNCACVIHEQCSTVTIKV